MPDQPSAFQPPSAPGEHGPVGPPPVPAAARVEPLEDRAYAAIFGLLAYCLLALAVAGIRVVEVDKLDQVIDLQDRPATGQFDLLEQARLLSERNDLADLAFLVWIIGAALAGITFLRWLHRAYGNLDAIAPGTRRYDTGWAIVGWLVPVLGLWRPKQVANDIARGVDAGRGLTRLLSCWWGLWLLTVVLAGPWIFFSGTNDPEAVRTLDTIHVVTSVLVLVPAAVAVVVVLRVTRAHARAAAPDLDRRPERLL